MYLDVDLLLLRVDKAMLRQFVSLVLFQSLCYVSVRTESPETIANGLVNVSETIAELLDEYDIRLRPQFGGMCSF